MNACNQLGSNGDNHLLQQMTLRGFMCSASDEKDRRIAGLAAEIGRLKKKLELFKNADLQFQQQKKDMHNAGKP